VGNLLEPRLMGSSMNISPLVAILSLSVWGVLWGITGMILSVPITVIMVIIFAQFEATRPVAIMLSEKGQIDGGRKRPRKEERVLEARSQTASLSDVRKPSDL